MSQIEGLRNNSATLALPMEVGVDLPRRPVGSIGQIPRCTSRSTNRLPVWNCASGTAQLMALTMRWPWIRSRLPSSPTKRLGDANARRSLEQQARLRLLGRRHGHCPSPRRRSCDSGAARENACRSTASGSNETGAPDATLKHRRHNKRRIFSRDPASSGSSLRSSKMIDLCSLVFGSSFGMPVVVVCGLAIVVALLPARLAASLDLILAAPLMSVGLNTISGLLKGVVAKPLGSIQQNQQDSANFEQQVVFPLSRDYSSQEHGRSVPGTVRSKCRQLFQLPITSATLRTPQLLEQSLLSGNPGAIAANQQATTPLCTGA